MRPGLAGEQLAQQQIENDETVHGDWVKLWHSRVAESRRDRRAEWRRPGKKTECGVDR